LGVVLDTGNCSTLKRALPHQPAGL